LAEAGYAVLVFDYRGFGDSEGEPRQLVSFRKQLEDWSAAIAFACALREVAPDRIVTWGFSLGGGHALAAGARDGRVKAVIAVAPMFDGISSTLAAVRRWSPRTFLRIVTRALRDLVGAVFGRSPVTVPFSAPPGEVGLLTSPDAYPGYEAMAAPDFVIETPARIALLFWTYLPGLLLRRLAKPVLVLVSAVDAINPPGPTIRRAKRCRSATIVELDCEHMAIANEPNRSRVVASTLELLREHVPLGEVE
jgi:pimeloyl-ACP methyl ester carboxylesterase